MDLNWIWHTILIFIVGKFVLRIGGRKSISQMTITQTIVMVGIGSLLIQPVSGKGLLVTFLVSLLIIVLMIISEYLEMKLDFVETIFTGKSKIVVENGIPNIQNLKKLRLSIDRLETRLRQNGITSIDDLKYATIEVSGQLGYELKDNKKPLTQENFKMLMNELNQLKQTLSTNSNQQPDQITTNNLFEEINSSKYEGNQNEPQG